MYIYIYIYIYVYIYIYICMYLYIHILMFDFLEKIKLEPKKDSVKYFCSSFEFLVTQCFVRAERDSVSTQGNKLVIFRHLIYFSPILPP